MHNVPLLSDSRPVGSKRNIDQTYLYKLGLQSNEKIYTWRMLSRKLLVTISAEITTTKVLPLWPLMYGHASLNHQTNLSCSFSVEEEALKPQLQIKRALREFVECLLFRLERGIEMWFLLKASPPVVPAKSRGGLEHGVAAMREIKRGGGRSAEEYTKEAASGDK
jgi:hypothetical protein